jgi:hypothetical protein
VQFGRRVTACSVVGTTACSLAGVTACNLVDERLSVVW